MIRRTAAWAVARVSVMVCALTLAAPALATTATPDGKGGWHVVPGPDDAETLTHVLNHTAPGGTVKLAPGVFVLSHNVYVANFQGTIEGAGRDATTVVARNTAASPYTLASFDPADRASDPLWQRIDRLNLPDRSWKTVNVIAPFVFTESDHAIDGTPVTSRPPIVSLRGVTVRIEGNAWLGYNGSATRGGLPTLVNVYAKDSRWFRPEHTLVPSMQAFADGRSFGDENVPGDPGRGHIHQIHPVALHLDDVWLDGISRFDGNAPYIGARITGGATSNTTWPNAIFKPVHATVTVRNTRLTGFRGHALFLMSSMGEAHPDWDLSATSGRGLIDVRGCWFEGTRRNTLLLGSAVGTDIVVRDNTFSDITIGPFIDANFGPLYYAWLPVDDTRAAVTRIDVRNNVFDITHRQYFYIFGATGMGHGLTLVNLVPEATYNAEVVYADNLVVLGDAARTAGYFQDVGGLDIRNNEVVGTAESGLYLGAAHDVSVTGNTFAVDAEEAVLFGGDSSDVLVRGNEIEGSAATGIHAVGGAGWTLKGNDLSGLVVSDPAGRKIILDGVGP